MKITDIDKNFIQQSADDNTAWIDAKSAPFKICGVFYDDEHKKFVRVPHDIATATSEGVNFLATNTAGGRVIFKTNSSNVSIKCTFPNDGIMTHMPLTGSNGFSTYVNGKFHVKFSPEWTIFKSDESEVTFTGKAPLPNAGKMQEVKIYFPLYGGVNELFIGLDENCEVVKSDEYKYDKPVVYYGSSITQGGCASRPGNDYQGHIERWLNADYVNLGFSGNGKGEIVMADYIISLNPSVVVMDYDYNAPDAEHLKNTHYPFYKHIRSALPDVPIIFITKPDFYRNVKINGERRNVIKKTYLKSIEEGDKLTAFIDGKSLFGKKDYDACTVDGCHPNDLGFYRMAKKIYPAVKKFIKF